jgi:biopolymer transport protein ExbD
MRRTFKKKQLTDEAIPTVSLIDISFLLIIFFILTTTFQKGTGFVTDIPGGEKKQEQMPQKTPTVGLRAHKILFNDLTVSKQELRRKLMDLRLGQQAPEGRVVLLEASENIPYQDYFEIMAMVTAAGGAVAIVREKGSR